MRLTHSSIAHLTSINYKIAPKLLLLNKLNSHKVVKKGFIFQKEAYLAFDQFLTEPFKRIWNNLSQTLKSGKFFKQALLDSH